MLGVVGTRGVLAAHADDATGPTRVLLDPAGQVVDVSVHCGPAVGRRVVLLQLDLGEAPLQLSIRGRLALLIQRQILLVLGRRDLPVLDVQFDDDGFEDDLY